MTSNVTEVNKFLFLNANRLKVVTPPTCMAPYFQALHLPLAVIFCSWDWTNAKEQKRCGWTRWFLFVDIRIPPTDVVSAKDDPQATSGPVAAGIVMRRICECRTIIYRGCALASVILRFVVTFISYLLGNNF